MMKTTTKFGIQLTALELEALRKEAGGGPVSPLIRRKLGLPDLPRAAKGGKREGSGRKRKVVTQEFPPENQCLSCGAPCGPFQVCASCGKDE